MHWSERPIRKNVVSPACDRDAELEERQAERRLLLLRALPVAVLLLGLLGVSMILSSGLHPPSGPRDNGVRKMAPEVPSATPHPPRPCSGEVDDGAPPPKLLVHVHP